MEGAGTSQAFSKLLERTSLRQLTPIDVFPVSLSMIHAAGLGEYLSDETVQKLKHIEIDLQENVKVSGVLRATTHEEMLSRLGDAFTLAATYYVQSGIAIWTDLNLDYTKLMDLTRVSCNLIEDKFLSGRRKLSRSDLVNTIASIRVLREVGRLTTEEQETAPPGNPPMSYLFHALLSTFILWCLLVYLQGDVKDVPRANIKRLAVLLFEIAELAYREAAERGLFRGEAATDFWSPDWQKGEVEADLDKRDGKVKSFSSVDELIENLHSA